MSLSQSFSQKIGNARPLNPCPSLDIDFANGGYVTDLGFADQASVGSANFNIGAFNGPDPVFTRSSAATFRGSNGLIQYAPENLIDYSEDLSNAQWNKWNTTTVESNVEAAPNGLLVADKIKVGSTNTFFLVGNSTTVSIGVSYIFSVYAKDSGGRFLLLRTQNLVGPAEFACIDLTDNSYVSRSGTSVYVNDVGNGWKRVSATFIPNASGTGEMQIGVNQSKSLTLQSYLGNGTSGIYIWGAQLERSSTARPYISTTALPIYGPRFEYDLSGNPLGLLMEEQSANVFQYSEQFNNASFWTPTNITVAADQITSPSGLLTADKLTTSGAAATQRISYNTTQTGSSTYSIYVKAGTASFVQLMHGSSANIYANFNISTGVTGNVGSSATSSITSVGNGWYRCVVSATVASTSSWHLYVVQSNTAAYGAAFSATVANLYVWGAQLEAKSFVTSYMPTVGGTSTRNADVVNSTISSWFNQTEGTVVVSGDRNNNPTLNSSGLDSFFEFTGTASYLLVHACDGTTEAVYDASGSPATTVGVTIGSLTSIAASYSDTTDLLHISRNGLATQSGPSTGLGVAPTTLNIGYAPVSLIGYWNGHIKSFRYFPKALPNNLQRLSS